MASQTMYNKLDTKKARKSACHSNILQYTKTIASGTKALEI